MRKMPQEGCSGRQILWIEVVSSSQVQTGQMGEVEIVLGMIWETRDEGPVLSPVCRRSWPCVNHMRARAMHRISPRVAQCQSSGDVRCTSTAISIFHYFIFHFFLSARVWLHLSQLGVVQCLLCAFLRFLCFCLMLDSCFVFLMRKERKQKTPIAPFQIQGTRYPSQ